MSAREETVGRSIGGKYRLGEVLAVGGMGVVHAGVHLVTGRAVAVKRLRSEFVARPDIVRRVSLEASLAVDASHPNVVEVIDAGADASGVPYLVLERLYGRPLEALLDQPLPLLATAQALMPVANAVAALHRIGIVHRDIKPSNIFVHRDAEGRVTPKLLDFGIAKALARAGATLTGGALGTPAYMAPEQLLGYDIGGAAADVWSIGVVFARCLTGRLPFDNATAVHPSLRSALRSPQLSGVPEPIAALLARSLAFEPSERPSDMAAFREALIQALAAVDASAPWPGQATIGYAGAEFVLSSAIEVDAATMRPLAPGCPRPRCVETRTLPGAGRSLPARSAGSAPRPRLLLVAAALTVTGAAVMSAGSRARRGDEARASVEPPAASATARVEAAGPAEVSPPELVAPLAAVSAAPQRPASPPASPARAAHVSRARRAAVPPPTDGPRPRKPPDVEHAPSARASSPSRADVSSKVRVGANRAPIIE